MFEILENLNVLHSQINPEKDNSEVTIFKVNLNKDNLFKISNSYLNANKDHLKLLNFLNISLNGQNFNSLNNYMALLETLFICLARNKGSAIFINLRLFINKFKFEFWPYFLLFSILFDLISRSLLYKPEKELKKLI